MDPIPRERMGNATSLFNLMRISAAASASPPPAALLARKQQEYINVSARTSIAYSPPAQNALESARQGFLASGADAATATQRAYAAVTGMVQRRRDGRVRPRVPDAGDHLPLLVPLVLLMRRPRTGRRAGAH